ncbi:fatty acid CoA ligase family protein [Adhaeretor mobilis]|uniref:Long-chain-fatty-acid--CoA ligase n=1 Tax=Adhaeretor mobilis TaxID=1930276 RepID=A0A517MS52_9BACT|nr:fatty acid CoA ligase family protein [Adhaeretor mobilis]QDS97712.1 Long-chain-fatty-acid--CoA ligase [Adhaeretor mobilis]
MPAVAPSLVDHDPTLVNVGDRLREIAAHLPDAIAVACPGRGDVAGQNSYATCTFSELKDHADALARGLVDLGVEPGMRLALLVKPGVEFVKLVFALLRSGATTVLIDPGMGRKHVVDCLASMQPEGFVAVSAAQALRTVLRRRFPEAVHNVTVGRRWFWGGPTFQQLLAAGDKSTTELPITRSDDPAAIIFTSGSTGPPKGVVYTHRMFDTQALEIQRAYDIQPGGADLACFALFGLFNSAMGVTTVFPQMDFSRPASAEPQALLTAARDWQVTQAFASPSVWDKLSRHCEQTGDMIPTLRKVFSCGAPVPAEVLQRTLKMIAANAEMHTPYGATESLPVATIEASEVLGETAGKTAQGAGVCVGRKFDTIDWRVIRISDEPIDRMEDTEELPTGEIGELIARGPQVSTLYESENKRHNAIAKIDDGDTVWHRLGDVGYFDEQQRFWYCGRKAHRVEMLQGAFFPICCESVFNSHPAVHRTALVGPEGRGKHRLVLYVEPTDNWQERNANDAAFEELGDEIRQLTDKFCFGPAAFPGAAEFMMEQMEIVFDESLPVDVRHNAKINRELIAEWASKNPTSVE